MKTYTVSTQIIFDIEVNDEDDIESEVKNVLRIIDAEDAGWIEYEERD